MDEEPRLLWLERTKSVEDPAGLLAGSPQRYKEQMQAITKVTLSPEEIVKVITDAVVRKVGIRPQQVSNVQMEIFHRNVLVTQELAASVVINTNLDAFVED